MKIAIIAIAVALAVLAAACTTQTLQGDAMTKTENSMIEKTEDTRTIMAQKTTDTAANAGEMMENSEYSASQKNVGATLDESEKMMEPSYVGKILAGKNTPYLEFNEADYKKANVEGKTILLYFYASWCPTCKAEQPIVFEAFNNMDNDQFVGFRVRYKDGESNAEKELARKFGVPYQHTKVIVKNYELLSKSPETWDAARYASEVAKYS